MIRARSPAFELEAGPTDACSATGDASWLAGRNSGRQGHYSALQRHDSVWQGDDFGCQGQLVVESNHADTASAQP